MKTTRSAHPENPIIGRIGVQTILAASIALALTFTLSCSSGDDGSSGVDEVGGKGNDIANYRTKQIGDQVWMAENLNYAVSGSKCYNNQESNCTTYGRLYDWSTAMALSSSCNSTSCSSQITAKHRGICPSGWHIPSYDEWAVLTSYIQGDKSCTNCEAKHLKSTSEWNWDSYNEKSGNGTDAYGFSALPGGHYEGGFGSVGDYGDWWSSRENDRGSAYNLNMEYRSERAHLYQSDKPYLFSVRCVQD